MRIIESRFSGPLVLVVLAIFVFLSSGCDEAGPAGPTGGVSCNDQDVCVLTGTITDDVTLTSDKTWILRGGVFIGDDVNRAVLTIQPGVTVFGESGTRGMLVVTRNSKIIADGTLENPIVFTSSKEIGSRQRGDWGGVIINGKAPLNACGEETAGCEAFGEGGTGWYGGDDPADDSGVLRYVRIEFAGTIISPDNELNGIAFQGVGSGTVIDYLQVHMNKDDGIEFFGGTAQAKHLVVTGVADDSLDWTDGWTGKVQYAVLQQYDDEGDQGIEADNSGENNSATPRSNPTLSNLTIIGSPESSKSDIGVLLREGTAASIHSTIVTGFNEACMDVDNNETFSVAGTPGAWTGELKIENSIVSCAINFQMNDEKDDEEQPIVDPWSVQEWFEGQEGNRVIDPLLVDAFSQASPDWSPLATSPALNGGDAPADSFFDQVDFVGAIGAEDWTAGWITSELN